MNAHDLIVVKEIIHTHQGKNAAVPCVCLWVYMYIYPTHGTALECHCEFPCKQSTEVSSVDRLCLSSSILSLHNSNKRLFTLERLYYTKTSCSLYCIVYHCSIRSGFLAPAAGGQKNARRASKKCPPGFEGKCFIVNLVFIIIRNVSAAYEMPAEP